LCSNGFSNAWMKIKTGSQFICDKPRRHIGHTRVKTVGHHDHSTNTAVNIPWDNVV
jgi:hypothetical protein